MGQSLIVALPRKWQLSSIASLLGSLENASPDAIKLFDEQLEISISNDAWVVIEVLPDRDLVNGIDHKEEFESDPDLDTRFRRDLDLLHFFAARYNDLDLMRGILRRVAQEILSRDEIAWIDTDNGWAISVRDFLEKTDQDPTWDWRVWAPDNKA